MAFVTEKQSKTNARTETLIAIWKPFQHSFMVIYSISSRNAKQAPTLSRTDAQGETEKAKQKKKKKQTGTWVFHLMYKNVIRCDFIFNLQLSELMAAVMAMIPRWTAPVCILCRNNGNQDHFSAVN